MTGFFVRCKNKRIKIELRRIRSSFLSLARGKGSDTPAHVAQSLSGNKRLSALCTACFPRIPRSNVVSAVHSILQVGMLPAPCFTLALLMFSWCSVLCTLNHNAGVHVISQLRDVTSTSASLPASPHVQRVSGTSADVPLGFSATALNVSAQRSQ